MVGGQDSKQHTVQPYVTGTSVIGLKCADGVVLGADTLGEPFFFFCDPTSSSLFFAWKFDWLDGLVACFLDWKRGSILVLDGLGS
mmetsp:Transcript_27948/g.109675  ORF Transcript_27948/g.109675 Transcript_27948/m.109675 type:complete len:85 (-) Transcript_27948:2507-2761(-)